MAVSKASTPRLSTGGLVIAWGALLMLVCVFLIRLFNTRLGHDQMSYLLEAQRMLSGYELYGTRISETNPPVIIWFSALPVLMAHLFHVSPVVFLRIIVLFIICGCIAWCAAILRRGAAAITTPAALAIVTFAILLALFSIGRYLFCQREHLLLILLLPYLLAVATGVVNRLSFIERCALGCAAGLAIWFKPHDVLVLVGLELFLALQSRTLRHLFSPELISSILSSALILGCVYVFAPLYRQTLPLLFDAYWAMGTINALPLALNLHKYILAGFIFLSVLLFFRRSLRDPATPIALFVCSVAAFVACVIQHNDWSYHRYPHEALLLIAFAYLFTDLLAPFLVRFMADGHLQRQAAFVVCGLVAGALCFVAFKPRNLLPPPFHTDATPVEDYLVQYPRSTTVYVFSTNVLYSSAAYNLGLNWGSRFVHLWMLPAIIQNQMGPVSSASPFKRLPPERVAYLADLQRAESADDLNYWKPSVVLVQQCTAEKECGGMEGKNVNIIGWFIQNPEFAAAWSHYQKQPGIDNFDIYKLIP
jgi:hypothetical protein